MAGGLVKADDGKAQTNTTAAQKDAPKKEMSSTAEKKKDDVTASANKIDLSTPASKLNFYGCTEVGVGMSSFKDACTNKTIHANESFYRMTVGTDVKLTEDITLGLEVSSARGQVRFH